MVDQFDELFGFMWLDVPAALLRPGRPLRLKVAGEKAGSNDWVMTFRDDLRREVWARSEQALVREDGKLCQIVRVEMSHLGPPAKAVVSCGEAEKASLDLKLGYNALEFLLPAVEEDRRVTLEVALDDGSVRRGELVVKPVVRREIWLLPHSHVDIGYSDPQPVVEKNHWRYIREAIALAEKTAGYPEGARFKWNTEQAWAVETYFRQAGEADKAAFIEADAEGLDRPPGDPGRRPDRALPSRGAHPPDRLRPADSARRPERPSIRSWSPTSPASPGPSSRPWPWPASSTSRAARTTCRACFDGGDRIGWALKAWGDKPFYWVSPSGREKVLFWMAGRGYSWFHGLNMGSPAQGPALPDHRIHERARRQGLSLLDGPGPLHDRRRQRAARPGPAPTTVRSWNERVRLAADRHRHGLARCSRSSSGATAARCRVVRGDFTGYWEDGAASTARRRP